MRRTYKLEFINNYLFVLLALSIALFMGFYEHAAMTAYGKTLEQGERAAFAVAMILMLIFVYITWAIFLTGLAVTVWALTRSLKREFSCDDENPVLGRKKRIAILVLKCIATIVIGVMIYAAFSADHATVLSRTVYCVAAACSVASVVYNIYTLRVR